MRASLALKDRVCFRYILNAACKITADEATCLSLVLSEIVMNAIKYAHPDGPLVEINVSASVTGGGHPAVTISDNGKGLPADFDERRHGGAGFRIIRALAQKLQARLTIESSERGVSFQLLLPPRAPQGVQ
jgi:two-component sensor histidine kinase